MLRFSWMAVLALALLDSLPAAADSFWTHNGSEMRLRADGSARTFLYERPRPGIAAEGTAPGTVLFQGSFSNGKVLDWSGSDVDRVYSGTAFIFSARCGKRSYEVSGILLNDGHEIELQGAAPRVDRSTCQLKGTKDSTLNFKFVRSDEPSLNHPPRVKGSPCSFADRPADQVSVEEYEVCLLKEANSICRGRKEIEELVWCFRAALQLLYERSGLRGNAAAVPNTPFTSCKGGVCRVWGGGPSYGCERLDAMRVRECDSMGVDEGRCNEVSCPVRECRKMCAKAP